MRRYTFLLLAFFLGMSSVHAIGISIPSMNMAPNSIADVSDAPSKKELKALGNGRQSEAKPYKKEVLTASTCRSYEVSYNDCVEKIKTNRKAK